MQTKETKRSNREFSVVKLLVFFLWHVALNTEKSIALSFDSSKKNHFPVPFKEGIFVRFVGKKNLQCIVSEFVAATAAVLEVQ